MTTTYELYTNENGTPKAVEGKAPAIIERVEALETSVETLETSVETLETDVEALEETLDKGVVTSINGNTGDITPEQTGCLPLSGGTMTGVIQATVGDVIKKTTDNHFLSLIGATTNNDGAQLVLSGKDRETNSGWFALYARDGTTTSSFIGKPDGALQWKGQNVITSAGGTLTGALRTSNSISKSSDNSFFDIYGGTGYGKGSQLTLFGNGHTNKGQFTLTAHDGTNQKNLVGKADGTLAWNSNRLVTMPNYGAGISIATSTASYTAPSDGYLVLYMQFDEINIDLVQIKVNNVYVGGYRSWSGSWSGNNVHITLPLSKGDKVTGLLTNTSNQIKANIKTFFPMKGA